MEAFISALVRCDGALVEHHGVDGQAVSVVGAGERRRGKREVGGRFAEHALRVRHDHVLHEGLDVADVRLGALELDVQLSLQPPAGDGASSGARSEVYVRERGRAVGASRGIR